MNKQELIERVKGWGSWLVKDEEMDRYIKISKVRELINQLDEPQKVKIPKFVAEYIEENKKLNHNLYEVFLNIEGNICPIPFADWFGTFNEELFARAWLDGYEVEEELYIMPVPYK